MPCLPCAGEDECDKPVQTGISKISQTNDCQVPQHENETCNPFCGCNCCGHNLVFAKFGFIKTPSNLFIEKKQSAIHFFASQLVLQNIWQPPQLS